MFENPFHFFSVIVFSIVTALVCSWVILKLICSSRPERFSVLYISSGKSTTNARLLGGLGLSLSILASVCSMLFFYDDVIGHVERSILTTALLSIFLVTLYGYIDDKFEMRVRFKLALQLTSIISLSIANAGNISTDNPIIGFLCSSILGLALVNGTNLLDGLDTLSVKLGAVSTLAFLYLGFACHDPATIILSFTMLASMGVFYFFNKEPAKVYMGEIGGSIIGLVYFIQSSLCFNHLKTTMSATQAGSLILIAGGYPIFELSISFLRRILSKKTPFRGDRLHLHYILKRKYNLTASHTSSRIGLGAAAILAFGFLTAIETLPIIALAAVFLLTLQCYLWVCIDEWKAYANSQNAENVFKLFEGKKIHIIDSTQFSSIDISIEKIEPVKTSKKKAS